MRHLLLRTLAASAVLATTAGLSACSEGESPQTSNSPSASPSSPSSSPSSSPPSSPPSTPADSPTVGPSESPSHTPAPSSAPRPTGKPTPALRAWVRAQQAEEDTGLEPFPEYRGLRFSAEGPSTAVLTLLMTQDLVKLYRDLEMEPTPETYRDALQPYLRDMARAGITSPALRLTLEEPDGSEYWSSTFTPS